MRSAQTSFTHCHSYVRMSLVSPLYAQYGVRFLLQLYKWTVMLCVIVDVCCGCGECVCYIPRKGLSVMKLAVHFMTLSEAEADNIPCSGL